MNGEGSVFYVGSERRWKASYYDGNGRRRTLSGRTRSDVEARLREALTARDAGVLPAPASTMPTLAVWLQQWLMLAEPNVMPSTLARYRVAVERQITPLLGHLRLDRLTAQQIETAYARLAGNGLSDSTVAHAHAVLRRAIRVAVRHRLIPHSPLDTVKAPRISPRVHVTLTLDQVRVVLHVADADAATAARWHLALRCGLRQGEALGLRWRDLDLYGGWATIEQTVQRRTGQGIVRQPPKNHKPRIVPLDQATVAALRRARSAQMAQRQAAGPDWVDHDLVFANRVGGPVEQKTDYNRWVRLLDQAGVPRVRLHDARHTAATRLIQAGVDPRSIQEILGHADVAFTMRTYVHPGQQRLRVAAVALERLYRNGPS